MLLSSIANNIAWNGPFEKKRGKGEVSYYMLMIALKKFCEIQDVYEIFLNMNYQKIKLDESWLSMLDAIYEYLIVYILNCAA